ncbi:DUF1735 and LamG domain-containing protein [Dysgonomonas sp. 511]|uniref:DUF1735 and LamG domain-containing protein n=1 Tax=Dysgonomonas sp. 511 TaxID=2302930 RepID=UPI0013CF8AF3|nr:DUF1735 and LamG domain-containing protein [Dysgonomonas sp. 511]NDV79302.1 DUF1735 domain-containing protein [Dysgonomonas sp. 511]
MKHNKNIFALLLVAITLLVSGCKDADIVNEHHFGNRLYITSSTINDDLLIKPNIMEASREISYRIALPAEKDIHINFDAVPALTAAYNLIYGDEATALEPEYYEIPEKATVIKAGDVSGDNILINFMNTGNLDKSRRYVLPVAVVNASDIEIAKDQKTVFFIFKGAALINVVADISKIYFPIKWTSNVSSVPTITVEALVRSADWVAGRDNALSSVFGIEGKFLVRIGDGDRPRDQLQVVAPGGNFPAPNKVSGLPVNEWVHIAIVYDNTTKERLYYKDGELVYSDKAASGSLNLTSGCYIGYAWDATRWLPGEISEVRIWTVQRTAEQIAGNPYEVEPNSPGLIAYWKFNEGAGNVITDHTGNGNNITAANSASPTWVNVEIPQIN